MRIALFRRAHFNAAHRLHVSEWSEEKNKEIFSVCWSPNFHGHNYEMEVKVVGEVDPVTGMLIDLKELKRLIKVYVEDKLDHKNLNLDVPEFAKLNPTTENICFVIWNLLREQIDENLELKIRLYETPRNYAEYPA